MQMLEIDRQVREFQGERVSKDEARAMDSGRRLRILDDLYVEADTLADLKCQAIDLLTDAEISFARGKTSDIRADIIRAKATIKRIDTLISARKRQQSILQTVLRSPAA